METKFNPFMPVFQRLQSWLKSNDYQLNITGITPEQWLYILDNVTRHHHFAHENNIMIFCDDDQEAEKLYELFNATQHLSSHSAILFPGNEFSPYNGIIGSESSLFQRFSALYQLSQSKSKNVIFTTLEAAHLRMPTSETLGQQALHIEISDVIDPYELAQKLETMGYTSAITCEEAGTYSHKGEIFDIYPNGSLPVRLNYFDDMIEYIYPIEVQTYKTLRDKPLETLSILPTPHFILNEKFVNHFINEINEYLETPKRELVDLKRDIFDKLKRKQLFEDYTKFVPLFFEQTTSLLEFLNTQKNLIIFSLEASSGLRGYENYLDILQEEFKEVRNGGNVTSLLPSPDKLYKFETNTEQIHHASINSVQIDANLECNDYVFIGVAHCNVFLQENGIYKEHNRDLYIQKLFEALKKIFEYSGNIIFQVEHNETKERLEFLFESHQFSSDLRSRIHIHQTSFHTPFYYSNSHTLILTESELFKIKNKKKKKLHAKASDLFAEQLATLQTGDFVIHREYGIARYLGMEMVTLGEVTSDFLILEFQKNDKIYLPVYKMNLIQKQASSDAELSLASLRNNKFNQIKAKAKNSAKKLAFDLLRLQAEREGAQAFSFSEPSDLYDNFIKDFPFKPTPDQEKAIDLVIDDMQKNRPMDHLVCGDVGFGKTEVAMRAAFKAIEDHKQVAVLVPTTVLALQHFNTFLTRFKNFPVTIEFLSRFKSAKESKEIKEQLREGKIDIVIGTHKLLSKDIVFHDLGLVIVDEEQRFGVGHKEKLKLLKKSVDFLTLSATPIPRTLQFSMLGLKDLSLIKTPPPRRQSIKSYLVVDDDQTIQKALQRELARGGQVFIVHNRVSDIEEYVARIRDLVPHAKIVYAHGQMSEKELESRISAFYKGLYQILISTTIIESGIDIPNANTMIINRADRFGLSQLHQLRGRIGRSDKKAYAYFVIPKHMQLSEIASQRLQALQTYSDMGCGFNIASVDLEIRGAGDLLGAEQSGHLHSIGLELYLELLQETIYELKGETHIENKDIEIQTNFASFIPQSYITDPQERLKYYKKLSNAESLDELEESINTLIDVFGPIPQELQELEALITTRIVLMHTAIKNLKVVGKVITMEFDFKMLETSEELKNKIITYFMSQPKRYKFTPDHKVIYQHPQVVDSGSLINFAKTINDELSN